MDMENPPEAASKELVAKAFQWHQNQPQAIRDMVQTKEQLVALYRKHMRKETENDAPVSSKVFVSELKTLAKGLEAFDVEATPQQPSAPSPTSPVPPPPQTSASAPAKDRKTSRSFSTGKIMQPQRGGKPGAFSMEHEVDPRTRQMLTEVRLRLNLSNDSEALRMLVAIGYEKISKI